MNSNRKKTISMPSTPSNFTWAYLIHLGFNMWSDRECPDWNLPHISAKPYLRVDKPLWDEILVALRDAGFNMLVIDLGEGVKYASHPEIAVKGSWTPRKLRRELDRIRAHGLEPIPKLNFSTAHDAWLGPYGRCVSTEPYYRVCKDLIAEAIDLFDKPRFMHLGMDEETARHQKHYTCAVIRQHELWWHDLRFLCEHTEKCGVRPWIWSDYVWNNPMPEEFFRNVPQSVLQSNWYYKKSFSKQMAGAQAYRQLDAHGYDQIPTGSTWTCPENIQRTVSFCRKHVSEDRLKGFMMTVWKPTLTECRENHFEAIRLAAKAIRSVKSVVT